MTPRREFVKAAGLLLAGSAFANSAIAETSKNNRPDSSALLPSLKISLPELSYPYEGLEPYIDRETMRLHHSIHHQGYVNGFKAAEKALSEARAKGEYSLIEYWSKKASFHGGGHVLHSLFWSTMAPSGKGGGGEPTGMIEQFITRDFGSFSKFREHFSAAANNVEGSGWALLHYDLDRHALIIMQAENQHKLSSWRTIPILGIDVWEHAYYLKYQNRRAEYIENWWNVVNWKAVDEMLGAARAV